MSRRWSLALGLSVLVHLALIGLPLGLGAWRPSGPVDIELTGLKLEEVKDLPLGGPAGGKGAAHAPRRAHHRAPAEGTLAAKADARERPGRATSSEDDTAPAPSNDLSSYGPKGSRLTILLRLDRLRGSDYVAPVDALLQRLPDRRDLLEGTGLDLFESFDALLIATPHPLDPSVTFLAARHRLDDATLRAALNRGAKATDRVIAWRTQAGRPVGERRPRRGLPPGAASRDDRLIVLAAPGLAIVTPPAYRALLMAPRAPAPVPDGGAAPEGADGGAPDGGAPGAAAWATMLDRIDAEEGLIPLDGVAMVSAVDIFKTSAHASGVPPVLYGMEVPSAVSAVIGLDDDGVFLDLDGQFPVEGQARHWEDEWPTLQHKLAANPIVLLTGFSPLVSHATLTRDGLSMRLHVSATHDETQRLLALALRFLGG